MKGNTDSKMLIVCRITFLGGAIGAFVGGGECSSRCTGVGKCISISGRVWSMFYRDRLLGCCGRIPLLKRHGMEKFEIKNAGCRMEVKGRCVMVGVVKHLAGAGGVPRMTASAPLRG